MRRSHNGCYARFTMLQHYDMLLRELMTTGWLALRLSAKCGSICGDVSCAVPQDVCSPSGVPDASEYEQRPASAAGISAHYPGRRGSQADGSGNDAKGEPGQPDCEVHPWPTGCVLMA